MKAIEDLKAALAAATPGGLYPSVEEVRLLCGTPDFTLYAQLLEHASALIECAEALKGCRELILEMGHVIRRFDENSTEYEFWTNDGEYVPDERFNAASAALAKLQETKS